MIKINYSILTKALLVSMISVFAISSMAFAEENLEIETEYEYVSVNTVDWDNFNVSIDSENYQFPMSKEELNSRGWVFENKDYEDFEFGPLEYGHIKCVRENDSSSVAYFFFANQSSESKKLSECEVCGVDTGTMYMDKANHSVVLPGDVVIGESTDEYMYEVYGEEDAVEDSTTEGFTTYMYSDMENKMLLFDVDESGVIQEFQYVDANMNAALLNEVNFEFDEDTLTYEKPEELGEDYDDYRVKIDEDVYTLPVPVMELVTDDWYIEDLTDGDILVPGQESYRVFERDGITFEGCIKNVDSKMKPEAECWITSIRYQRQPVAEAEADDYSYQYVELPGEIIPGMTEEELIDTLSYCEVPQEDESTGNVYSYFVVENDPEIETSKDYVILALSENNTYIVTVYTGTDGLYPENTVSSIYVANDPTYTAEEE